MRQDKPRGLRDHASESWVSRCCGEYPVVVENQWVCSTCLGDKGFTTKSEADNRVATLEAEVAGLREAIKSAGEAMAFSSRDMSLCKRDAWVYGILLGWDDDALPEVAEKHGWSPCTTERLARMRKSTKGGRAMKYYYRAGLKLKGGFFPNVISKKLDYFAYETHGRVNKRHSFRLDSGELITVYADSTATLELKTTGFIRRNWILGVDEEAGQ